MQKSRRLAGVAGHEVPGGHNSRMQELERYPDDVMEELAFLLRYHMQHTRQGNERESGGGCLQDWFADERLCLRHVRLRYEGLWFYLDDE